MATSTYGTPYVQGSDLVSAYPTVSSSLATRVDEVSYRGNGLNAQTGTSYSLLASDAGKTITLSNAAAVAVTLPQDSVATLPTGAVVTFYNLGAGMVTISQGTGATLNGGSITLAQYEVTSVIKLSANTYGRYDGAPGPGLSQISPTSIANSGGTASLSDGTTTFTSVTSVSLNGVFTSSYQNYKVVLYASGSGNMNIRMRTAGTDAAGANYSFSAAYATSWTGAFGTVSGASATSFGIGPNASIWSVDMADPFSAAWTFVTGGWVSTTGGFSFGGIHAVSSSYDGLTILGTTMTGKVRVYGYKGA